ncbi:MAG: hypothetical protein GY782_03355 [Gammaproteobacteria bacterium]|nr:hypothetical protein [Gammaproteobacteria bacterium]
MFNGNGTKPVGDDGFLRTIEYGAEIAGDGLTQLPVGTYLVTAVAGVSGFPAPASGGTAVAGGDILVVEGANVITPVVGDDVVTMTLTDKCDVSSWTMEFSKEEIEVTTLCDLQKKYRAGKADMTGTVNGLFVTGTTDAVAGPLQQFIDIVRQDGDASFDKFEQTEEIFIGFFYVNNKESLADKMWVSCATQLYGDGLGGEIGSAQSFSSSFRFGDLTYTSTLNSNTVSIQPTFIRLGDGA